MNSADPLITARISNGGAEKLQAFLTRFGEPDDEGYALDVADFDKWVADDFLDEPYTGSYFPHVRNRARYALNRMATTEEWIDMGGTPIDISVIENAVTYKVAKATTAFVLATVNFPAKVERVLKTKTDRVYRLVEGTDPAALNFETRVKAIFFRNKGADLARRFKQEMINYAADYDDLMKEITDQTGVTLALTPADAEDEDDLV